MNAKKWCIGLFSSIIATIFLIVSIVIYVDPYVHYHEPVVDMNYSAKNIYINDGMTRNCRYEAIITGTSTSGGFSAEEAEYIFGKKFICVPFPGESFKKVSDNLQAGFDQNEDLEMVIWGLDPMWFIAEADWLKYEEYPEYLYDDIWWNDVKYLLNGDILAEEIIVPILRGSANQAEHINIGYDDNEVLLSDDENSSGGNVLALSNYDRPPKETSFVSEAETMEMLQNLNENLEKNVFSRIEEHPDVTFYIFFPPYSILWWDSFHQKGEEILNRRLYMEQVAIEQLLGYENVRLFSFTDNYDLTCDLNNYLDDVHCVDEVYTWILQKMKNGEYELKKNNYQKYMKNISEFYNNYDYDSIFEE